MSHKSRRPVESFSTAEILAAAEAVDEGKILKSVFSALLCTLSHLPVALYSRDLLTSFSTQRNSVDISICADVNVIRYEYETHNIDEIVWIPGRVNLTNPGTKTYSALSVTLQLALTCEKK